MRVLRSLTLLAGASVTFAACSSSGGSQNAAPFLPASSTAASRSTTASSAAAPHALPNRIASAAAMLLRAPLAARRAAQSAVGTSNTTVADPPVPRPHSQPCVVPLFSGVQFADFNPKPFQFAPPAGCPPPWAKVVFELDLGVSAGVQFDRTATVGLGGATIFFGTTPEPSQTTARSWHVERDLTDESALFHGAQTGQISIGNVVNSTYTGVLTGTGQLEFYPPDLADPAPTVPDVVVPVADANGNPLIVQTSTDSASATFAPPRTVEAAELDVISQSQSDDEFWYTCFPDNLATLLDNCGNTGFRESEIALDGKPAGAAPVYPWIYTGGIDPFLWIPTPGVQTLNFTPYRVDLTPFAATLDDGNPHAVAVSVFNADHYFSVAGLLLLYLDHGARGPLSGGLDTDDVAAVPPEVVSEGGSFNSSGIGQGTIDIASRRTLHLRGHVLTSHGLVVSDLTQALSFVQHQAVTSSATSFVQDITQETTVDATSNVAGATFPASNETHFDWPLTLDYAYTVNPDGSATQTTSVDQRYYETSEAFGLLPLASLADIVTSADTLNFDATGAFTGNTANASAQTYRALGGQYGCYGRTVTSSAGVVTSDAPAPCIGRFSLH